MTLPAPTDADLAPIPRAIVLNALAEAALAYWEASALGGASLAEGRTVAARDWVHTLQRIALDHHPRVRALAQERSDQLDAALTLHLSHEVA